LNSKILMITKFDNYIIENIDELNRDISFYYNKLCGKLERYKKTKEYLNNLNCINIIDNDKNVIIFSWTLKNHVPIYILKISNNINKAHDFYISYSIHEYLYNQKEPDLNFIGLSNYIDMFFANFYNRYLNYDIKFIKHQIDMYFGISILDGDKYLKSLENILDNESSIEIYNNLDRIIHHIVDMNYDERCQIIKNFRDKYKYIINANKFDLI
jgi:hypothetical protein